MLILGLNFSIPITISNVIVFNDHHSLVCLYSSLPTNPGLTSFHYFYKLNQGNSFVWDLHAKQLLHMNNGNALVCQNKNF